jgi:hypothetical protein
LAIEVIACLALFGDKTMVMELLFEILEKTIYDSVIDRIEEGNPPRLKIVGGTPTIEFFSIGR